MRPVARAGDVTSHGGVIVTGSDTTLVNGKAVARVGDLHVCPKKGHGITPILTGSMKTHVDGFSVARVGDITGCGAVIVSGSPDTETQ